MNAHPYFQFRKSQSRKTPVLVSVPHAGLAIPELRKELMMLPETVFFRDVDFEIHRMWDEVCAKRDISFIKCHVHRYAIDLNRRADQKNLIWTSSTRQEPLAPQGSSFETPELATIQKLIQQIWNPYYLAIQNELNEIKNQFGFAILIDGHSMPSRGTAFHADPGGRRADVVPGDNKGQSCAPILLQAVLDSAKSLGLSAVPNQPYSGGNITQHFGRPQEGFHALQIEINRSIYIESEEAETKQIKDEGLIRLKNLADSLLEHLRWSPGALPNSLDH